MERRIVDKKGEELYRYSGKELPRKDCLITIKSKKYRVIDFDYNFDIEIVVIKVIRF